jgi:hypothetical protein
MASTKTGSPKPNLFKRAKSKPAAKKKTKGTVFELPADIQEGKLVGESQVLDQALKDLAKATKDKKAADNLANAAKGKLNRWVEGAYTTEWAKLGVQPPTPISIVGHDGDSATYVVADKSQQYGLDEEQQSMLAELLGEETAGHMIVTRDLVTFDPNIMAENAAGPKAKEDEVVGDIVAEIVSKAIWDSPKLSDKQKEDLIKAEEKTGLRPTILQRLAEFCGADGAKIKAVLGVIKSSCTRYLRV